jgi:hypothetical protein
MVDLRLLPPGFEVTVEDLQQTPPRVLKLLIYLLERLQALGAENAALKKRVAATFSQTQPELEQFQPAAIRRQPLYQKGTPGQKSQRPGRGEEGT